MALAAVAEIDLPFRMLSKDDDETESLPSVFVSGRSRARGTPTPLAA